MIKNNKGFMLIEVIVTSTIIVTSMIILYASFNRIYKNYNIRNSYYNIDAVYATKTMFQDILNNNDINAIINEIFADGTYGYFVKSNENKDFSDDCQEDLLEDVWTCSQISSIYHIKNMIIVKYDKNIIKEQLRPNISNETFREYTDYVVSYYDITMNGEYSYLLLTEIYDGSDYYYANLRVR